MKKKNKTYLLLAVVLGIWGVIIFKFIWVLNPSSEQAVKTRTEAVFKPKQIKERELFALALDYRDPFLGTVDVPRKNRKPSNTIAKPKKVIPTKSVEYTGFIQKSNSNQLIFFVTVEGRQQMMKINDSFQDVMLVKGTKKSITVKYGGSKENIALTK